MLNSKEKDELHQKILKSTSKPHASNMIKYLQEEYMSKIDNFFDTSGEQVEEMYMLKGEIKAYKSLERYFESILKEKQGKFEEK